MELTLADQPKLELGCVLYPEFTMLDLIGPQTVLSMHANTHFIAATMDPVAADSGGSLMPTSTFAGAPERFDILFVPGGLGTAMAMQDPETLAFLRNRGATADYITSVCTGSIVLAAAGLLDGYRAACHWGLYAALEMYEKVIPVRDERVVTDRNRITGGGVTAGVDFGLTLLSEIRGREVAELTQLMIEYDPAPPFNKGHPRVADAATLAMAKAVLAPSISGGGEFDMVRIAREQLAATQMQTA